MLEGRDAGAIEVHWLGKFRGPDFAPLTFQVKTVTHQDLKDSKGRLIPTVIASYLSETAQEEMAKVARSHEDELLAEINRNGKKSLAELAAALGWYLKSGEAHKVKAQRTVDALLRDKLITRDRDSLQLTEKGRKALNGKGDEAT